MDIQFDNQAVIVTVVERGARVWACDVLEGELAALEAQARPKRGGIWFATHADAARKQKS